MYKGIRDGDHSTDSAGWASNPDKDEFFSVLETVQAGSGPPQFSYSVGAWSSFPRIKGAGAGS